jgi:hypothetical protein
MKFRVGVAGPAASLLRIYISKVRLAQSSMVDHAVKRGTARATTPFPQI